MIKKISARNVCSFCQLLPLTFFFEFTDIPALAFIAYKVCTGKTRWYIFDRVKIRHNYSDSTFRYPHQSITQNVFI